MSCETAPEALDLEHHVEQREGVLLDGDRTECEIGSVSTRRLDWCRGVPVDEWAYNEATKDRDDPQNITGRYSVHLYFSSPEWHFGRSNGYRILQRVALKGKHSTPNRSVRSPTPTHARCHGNMLLQL